MVGWWGYVLQVGGDTSTAEGAVGASKTQIGSGQISLNTPD